jgi:hypothetical protein
MRAQSVGSGAYRGDVSQNVVQEKPSSRSVFEFKYLREFVDSATALGIPDHTEVWCNTSWWTGNVVRLRTRVRDEDAAPPPADAMPTGTVNGPGEAGDGASEKRTIVSQDSTGPRQQWRRWGRTISAPTLTLGDVRTLIARVDELGLPAEKYVVRGAKVARTYGQHVSSISAEPLI